VSRERGGEDKAGRSMTEKAQRHVNRGGATGYGGEGSGADASNPGEREREVEGGTGQSHPNYSG
jgi:hypothetical protein